MTIFPRIIQAPNGQRYACFFNAGYAYRWARQRPDMARKMAVRIQHLTAFAL